MSDKTMKRLEEAFNKYEQEDIVETVSWAEQILNDEKVIQHTTWAFINFTQRPFGTKHGILEIQTLTLVVFNSNKNISYG